MKKEVLTVKEGNSKIDLFWKARDFKPWEKSVDWYWAYWIIVFIFIFIFIYFLEDYWFSLLVFLIALVSFVGHRKEPSISEYRINENGILLNNGKKEILFEEIESFNIDYEGGDIFINTKNKLQKLISVPFEASHNITVIEKILLSKLQKDENLDIPFLERLFERMIGF